MNDAGELVENTLVATVMSNLGLHIAMREAGINIVTAAVGDRYVLEELRAGGYSLGGEQSGHVVLPAFGTTGDGILTGLRLLGRMARTGKSASALAATMTTLPQVLINVKVGDKATVAASPSVLAAVADAERVLGDGGRVLLRRPGQSNWSASWSRPPNFRSRRSWPTSWPRSSVRFSPSLRVRVLRNVIAPCCVQGVKGRSTFEWFR